jgi:hypothetical protein
MKNITPEIVVSAWDHMRRYYNTKIVSKKDQELMQMIGQSLDIMGILDKDRFLESYTTTIGDVIYVPFEIGVDTDNHPLHSQLYICGHEHQHYVQWRDGRLQFMLEYLSDSTQRAKYEANAMHTSMEIRWWHKKELPNIPSYVMKLYNYNCQQKDIEVTQAALNISAKVVKQGGITTEAGKTLIHYLEHIGLTG